MNRCRLPGTWHLARTGIARTGRTPDLRHNCQGCCREVRGRRYRRNKPGTCLHNLGVGQSCQPPSRTDLPARKAGRRRRVRHRRGHNKRPGCNTRTDTAHPQYTQTQAAAPRTWQKGPATRRSGRQDNGPRSTGHPDRRHCCSLHLLGRQRQAPSASGGGPAASGVGGLTATRRGQPAHTPNSRPSPASRMQCSKRVWALPRPHEEAAR